MTSAQLPVGRDRYSTMVRQCQGLFDESIDKMNQLTEIVAELKNTTASVVLAEHAAQHQAGAGDEVFFSELERSALDDTQHDAYRTGPHITVEERQILQGIANHVFTSGFFPILTVDKVGTPTQVKLVPKWNSTVSPGYWMVTPTEVP